MSNYPLGGIVLHCDDGYDSQISQMLPVTDKYGVPVTFCPIAERIINGNTTLWTIAKMQEVQALHGWQVSCHAYAQAAHDGPLSVAATEADFQLQKAWLRSNGLGVGANHVACNPNTGSPVPAGSMLTMLRRNFRSARSNNGFMETTPPSDRHKLHSLLYSGNTLSAINTNAAACNGIGGLFIFTVHEIIAGSTNGTASGLPALAANNLDSFISTALGLGMVFRTMEDALAGR